MTDRNASLVLKTSDLTSKSDYVYGVPYVNQSGSMNAKGSSITWNNINLRTLLGDMYDRYDIFNICLKVYRQEWLEVQQLYHKKILT